MGLADRDYFKSLPSHGEPFARISNWSATIWLIAINVLVYFLNALLWQSTTFRVSLMELGNFNVPDAIWHLQIWRFITFQFLHVSIGHIAFNMIALYAFGPIVESLLGTRRYIVFYLLCGIAGAIGFMTLGTTPFDSAMMDIFGVRSLAGASAGIFGLLVASAVIAPNAEIVLILFTMTIRTAAILAMLLAAVTVVFAGEGLGGQAAHLGGGVLGFILVKNIHWLNFLEPSPRARMRIGKRRKHNVIRKDWSNDMNR